MSKEEIEKEAAIKSDPVDGSGCKKDEHEHDCGCEDYQRGYEAGAISAHNKAIQEAIEKIQDWGPLYEGFIDTPATPDIILALESLKITT